MKSRPERTDRSSAERLLARVMHDAGCLQAMLLQLPAPVYLLDGQRRVVFCNQAGERVLALPAA